MNRYELIKKVMASDDFSPDEKVEIIKALSNNKEYIYVPYEKTVTQPSNPWYNPPFPTYPSVTWSNGTTTFDYSNSADNQKSVMNHCSGGCRKHHK